MIKGSAALSGTVQAEAMAELREYLVKQQQGRSLGSGDEDASWLRNWHPRLMLWPPFAKPWRRRF